MPDYDETNTGALWIHDKQGNDRRPDRKGTLDVDGVKYWISGWIKTTRDGKRFLSLKVEMKADQPPPKGIAASLNPKPAPLPPADARSLYLPDDLAEADEIPF